jgi:acetyl esterase/lipase
VSRVLLYLHRGGFVYGLTPLHLQIGAHQDIGVAGDSAGGNLTIAMLMKLRDSGSSLPAAAACLSPVTDITPRDRLSEGFEDPVLPPKATKFYARSYVGRNDARGPYFISSRVS